MTNLEDLIDGFKKNVEAKIPTRLEFDLKSVSLTSPKEFNGFVGIVLIKKPKEA